LWPGIGTNGLGSRMCVEVCGLLFNGLNRYAGLMVGAIHYPVSSLSSFIPYLVTQRPFHETLLRRLNKCYPVSRI
jgi:hypothetical protein